MSKHLLLAVLLLAASLGLHCKRPWRSEIHLIPEGYVGPVAIIFDAEDGEATLNEENGALVFKIGTDGMLKVKGPPPPSGLVLIKYYYVTLAGARREIPDRGEDTLLQVFKGEHGSVGAIRRLDYDGRVVHEEPAGNRWSSYLVGAPSSRSAAQWGAIQSRFVDQALGRRPRSELP